MRNDLVDSLAKTYYKLMNEDIHRIIDESLLRIEDGSELIIGIRELKASITQSNKHSAGGDDGIRYRDLERLCQDDRIQHHILECLNHWIKYGLPSEAKIAKVCPIPKPGKDEASYRPISLLNCLPKLLERILTTRLRDYVEDDIPGNQCGCRRGLSTSHCVCRLLHASAKADSTSQQFGAVFMDYSKAYDRVDHVILLKKLKNNFQVPDALIRAIGLWLDQRTFYVDMNNSRSKLYPMTNGLPQGSSLSVLLWLVYVSDIPIPPETSTLFMDDTALWATASTHSELQMILQQQVNILLDWCEDNKIVVHDDKTKILLNEHSRRFYLKVGDDTCYPTDRLRYLGVILKSSKMSFGPIEVDMTEVAHDLLRRCRVLKPLYRKLPSKQFRMFAEGLILSKLRYYLPMIAGEDPKNLRTLRTAYRQCLRLVCGGLRTTPIPLLYSQSGMPSLDDLIRDSSARQLMRVTINSDSMMRLDYDTYTGERGSPYVDMHECISEMPPWLQIAEFESAVILTEDQLQVMFDTKFKILPTREAASIALKKGELIPEADLYLFTDGSYSPKTNISPELAGAGALVTSSDRITPLLEESKKVIPPCHSYHSEVYALIMGLQLLINNSDILAEVNQLCILTDCRSCLTHLESLARKMRPQVFESSEVIINLMDELQQLVSSIKLVWIPGHHGIEGNKQADLLAKDGRYENVTIGEDYPMSKFRYWIRTRNTERLDLRLQGTVKPSGIFPESPPRGKFMIPMNSPHLMKIEIDELTLVSSVYIPVIRTRETIGIELELMLNHLNVEDASKYQRRLDTYCSNVR